MRSIVRLTLILVFGLLFNHSNAFATDGNLDPLFATGPGYHDDVLDMALQPDAKLVVVGAFYSVVGVPTRGVARLDPAGNVDVSFKSGIGTDGDVYDVEIQADGKILIVGTFTHFNGIPANRVARLNSDGTLDSSFSSGTGANSAVYAVAIRADGKILIGGRFSSFNGTSRNSVARLNSDGSLDPSFVAPSSISYSNGVYAIASQGEKVIIGGGFNTSVGTRSLARLNADGSHDTSFIGTAAAGSIVRSVEFQGSSILVGGDFSSMDGVTRIAVARLGVNGSLDTSFVPSSFINSAMVVTAQLDGKVLVGGNGSVARLNSNGTMDGTFVLGGGTNRTVNTILAAPNQQILIGGMLSSVPTTGGGAGPPGVRKLNPDGSLDDTYLTRNGATDAEIHKMRLQPDGKILITGAFTTVGRLPRSGFARLNSDGTVDSTFDPGLRANAMATQPDGKIVIGGSQGSDGINRFYRLESNGTIDPSFSADSGLSSLSSPNVEDLVVQADGKILAVGSFETINGIGKKSLVRLDPDGNIDPTFNTNLTFTSAVIKRVVLQPDGKSLIAGRLILSPGFANVVFRLNTDGIADPTFSYTQPNDRILDLFLQDDGRIVIGGLFTSVNGFLTTHVARLTPNGGPDPTFVPAAIGGSSHWVSSVIAQHDGRIIVGGDFQTVGGTAKHSIARFNSNGTLDTSFASTIDTSINSTVNELILQPDSKFVMGGSFIAANGVVRSYISRQIVSARSAFSDFDGDGSTDISIFRPMSGQWWINRSTNGVLALSFGTAQDELVPADFTGDGKTDVAIFRPTSGEWFILRSEDYSFYSIPFGTVGDVPVPGDYDGDGIADVSVFRPSTATWYIQNSTGSTTILQYGVSSDLPAVADYDGDGKTDIAVFRPSGGEWWIRRSSGTLGVYTFGNGTDRIVPADYTGDGKADVAVWRPSTGEWFVLRSEDDSFYSFPFGSNGDVPSPGDYDGDGKCDASVFRPSSGTWFVNRSTAGVLIQGFGISGDIPVPSSYVR